MASDCGEKKSIRGVGLAQSTAKPGFMVAIALISYTFEQNSEAWKGIYLVKPLYMFKLFILSFNIILHTISS